MTHRSIAICVLGLATTVGTGVAMAQGRMLSQMADWRAANVLQIQYRDGDDDRRNGDFGEHERFRERGFREGFDGARKDFENHRFFTPMNRDEYRHPDDVPRDAIRTYRIAFREGYLRGEHEIEEQLEQR